MPAHIAQISISDGGIPKLPVPSGRITFDRVEGDNWNNRKHHGLPGQALCLFSAEILDELRGEGYPVFPGALGENITTRMLDFHAIRLGDLFHTGDGVLFRIAKVRVPCRTIAVYGEKIMRDLYDDEVKAGNIRSPKWGRSGFYAEVLKEGTVSPGDILIRQ